MRESIFKALGDRLRYQVPQSRQIGIKGLFSFHIVLDWVVLADLVVNDPLFKYFVFINEREKTILMKPRFFMYEAPGQRGIVPESLGLTLIQHGRMSMLECPGP